MLANSHKTAIHRRGASVPCRWLDEQGKLIGPVLDWGCGHGQDVEYMRNAFGHDPYHSPELPTEGELFNTVLCTYVLNTIPNYFDRCVILSEVLPYLIQGGWLYVTIRSDIPHMNGWTKKGTWQGYVGNQLKHGGFTLFRATTTYEIWGWHKIPFPSRVYWSDPDRGLCSRYYNVQTLTIDHNQIVTIEDIDGSVLECPKHELTF